MLSEKDLPGFQQTPARWWLPSVQRALLTQYQKPAGDMELDGLRETLRTKKRVGLYAS
jgi:hypothetical protein